MTQTASPRDDDLMAAIALCRARGLVVIPHQRVVRIGVADEVTASMQKANPRALDLRKSMGLRAMWAQVEQLNLVRWIESHDAAGGIEMRGTLTVIQPARPGEHLPDGTIVPA